jgi:hypothetical protein
VRLHHRNGAIDVISVWASGPEEAIDEAKRWIEGSQNLPVPGTGHEVRRIGSKPDPFDLGMGVTSDLVNHRRFTKEGQPLSTLFRAEPDHIRRSTRLLREGEGNGWRQLRELLKSRGISSELAAVVNPSMHDREPREPVSIVASDRRVFLFFRGLHPSVPDSHEGFHMETGPALEELDRPSEGWDIFVEAGFEVLDQETRAEGR